MAEAAGVPSPRVADEAKLRYGTPTARWVIIAAVLGSGIAFIDGTVVNVALPAIARDLGGGIAGLQWTVDAYLLTMGSLIIFGGSLGDAHGRKRIFVIGLTGFTIASLLCALAPNIGTLIVARALQGIAGALLVPSSLSIISATFHPDDRGQAIGAWSGLSGVSTAIGPFLGGYLVDNVSWEAVFLINVPLGAATIWLTLKHVPETRDVEAPARADIRGAATAALALGGIVYALIEGPVRGFSDSLTVTAAGVGVISAIAFYLVERRRGEEAMLPLSVFRSQQFVGANGVTLAVYAALSGAMFFLVLHLQTNLGYSALESGAAFFPTTLVMVALSSRAGKLSQSIGPRWPMTVGPIAAGVGLMLLSGVEHGTSYFSGVFPGVLVFALGLTLTVAPLTSAALAAVEQRHAGIASGVNNAVARLAGLVAVAALPFIVGLSGGGGLSVGYGPAMLLCGGLSILGGLLAAMTIRQSVRLRALVHPHMSHPCPHLEEERSEATRAA